MTEIKKDIKNSGASNDKLLSESLARLISHDCSFSDKLLDESLDNLVNDNKSSNSALLDEASARLISQNSRFSNGKILGEAIARLISYIEAEEYKFLCTKYSVNGFDYYVRLICPAWLSSETEFKTTIDSKTKIVEGNYQELINSGKILQLDFIDKFALELKLNSESKESNSNEPELSDLKKYETSSIDLYSLGENGEKEANFSFNQNIYRYVYTFIINLIRLNSKGLVEMSEERLNELIMEFIDLNSELVNSKYIEKVNKYQALLNSTRAAAGIKIGLGERNQSRK